MHLDLHRKGQTKETRQGSCAIMRMCTRANYENSTEIFAAFSVHSMDSILSIQISSYIMCSNSHDVTEKVFFKKTKYRLNSESRSRTALHQSRLPQRAILFRLVAPTGRDLSSAAKGEFSHSIDGHVQGVHGHVPGVPGVQGVPA